MTHNVFYLKLIIQVTPKDIEIVDTTPNDP